MIRLRVREMAVQKGMSQSKLSRRADVDASTMRKIYRTPESANITMETLNRLATALECDARDLIEYVPDAPG